MKVFFKSLLMAVTMCFALTMPAFATEVFSNFTDLENDLYSHFENRDTSFSFLYTGTTEEFKENINRIIRQAYSRNDYLERSWLEVKPLARVTSEGISTEMSVTYISTKEEENYVDNELLKATKSIITEDMKTIERIRAINDYIVNRYEYDYSLQSVSTYTALTTSKTVCQGYAMTAYKMLNYAGVENRIVVGTARGISHAWNIVKIDDSWYQLDVTNNDSVKADKYFLVSDKVLENNNYVWDRVKYPRAATGYYQ